MRRVDGSGIQPTPNFHQGETNFNLVLQRMTTRQLDIDSRHHYRVTQQGPNSKEPEFPLQRRYLLPLC